MFDGPTIPADWAGRIYDLLTTYGQASCDPCDREYFCHLQNTEHVKEFRFCGMFGFGGKFWNNDDRWYVNYYPENRTTERDKAEEILNEHLAALKAEYNKEQK